MGRRHRSRELRQGHHAQDASAIFCESIANPGGVIVDLPAIAAIARKAGVPLIVDNTLATPYLCRPKEHGADIVMHSLTKFMGGHGNSIGGVIVDCGTFDWLGAKHRFKTLVDPNPSYNGMKLAETFGNFAFAIACRVMGLRDLGPAMSPFNAFLILTGIETLPLRMAKHCENALTVAKHLEKHKQVDWVNYAGLPRTSITRSRRTICPKGAGSVFTFGLKGGYEAGVKLVSGVKLFSHLANIGDVRSLSSIRPPPPIASSPTSSARPPAPAPTWCASRSAWRTPPTSSPIWSRAWRAAAERGALVTQQMPPSYMQAMRPRAARSWSVSSTAARSAGGGVDGRGNRRSEERSCGSHGVRPSSSAGGRGEVGTVGLDPER